MQDFLVENAKIMGINLDNTQIEKLLTYADLIAKWNKVYNLTAIKGTKNIITHHILDSLSILKLLGREQKILDIGTGAGLPAVIIAIMSNNLVVAIDKVGKKTKFVQFVKSELKLNTLEVVNDKVENMQGEFDIITSRAFAEINKTISLSSHLLKNGGKFLLMKGNNYKNEAVNNLNITSHQVVIPNLTDDRYILEINLG